MKRTHIIRTPDGDLHPMLHGGDYNPDQWIDSPDILTEDIRLMKLANVNAVSVGIFAWVALEPAEDTFTFEWLDETLDRLHKAGIGTFLATPTGARPAWMSQKYPEVLRVAPDRTRNLHGRRHNHCYTSPVYRNRTRIINQELARRYGSNPAVRLWHLSNEYGGECHCPLCQGAFRDWLAERYANDLDRLNRAWWTSFWSHTYTDWSQIESPSPRGEQAVHGHNLDWKRFVTHQTRDFMRHEIASVRDITNDIPFTTNLMGFYPGIDYFKLAEDIDVVSWDSYPMWHSTQDTPGIDSLSWEQTPPEQRDARLAGQIGTIHDVMRGCKRGKPFLLMESVPSATNWFPVGKRKRPGAHVASSLLAIAHGSDSVQYFQWRKSRGSSEKLHGAVVDHAGHENTRVFNDVKDVGDALAALGEVAGTHYPAEAAVIFDWENRWAINDAQGPRNDGRKGYESTVERHAYALSRQNVNLDVIDSEQSFERYKLLVAPMLAMVKPGVAERIDAFVRSGGILVTTYWSGIVDESDLCFLGGFPGPLSELLGIWSEEIDAIHPEERNTVVLTEPLAPATPTAASKSTRTSYEAYEFCDLIHLRGAKSLAEYGGDFYAGRPALTVNNHGDGRAYYIASRNEDSFLSDFYATVASEAKLSRVYPEPLAPEVHATLRSAENDDGSVDEFRFLINFASETRSIPGLAPGERIIYRSPGANTGVGRLQDGERQSDTALASFGVQIRRLTR